MSKRTMREIAEGKMKKELGEAWSQVINEMNDGKYHKAAEIAKKFDLTIGETASNLAAFRGKYSTLGYFKVQSKKTTRKFAELDDDGNMTGVIIKQKGSLVWKLGDAKEA